MAKNTRKKGQATRRKHKNIRITRKRRGGTIPTGDTQYLNGQIAQASIYNRALSATEVLQNFNAQKARFGL